MELFQKFENPEEYSPWFPRKAFQIPFLKIVHQTSLLYPPKNDNKNKRNLVCNTCMIISLPLTLTSIIARRNTPLIMLPSLRVSLTTWGSKLWL